MHPAESRELILISQATITSLNTVLFWPWRFPNLMEDSYAPLAAEVERIRSNFMAHIAPYRSRTCWQNMATKAGKTGRRFHAKAPRKFAQRRVCHLSPADSAGYGPPTQFMLVS